MVIESFLTQVGQDAFTQYGLLLSFLYELFPAIFRVFGTTIIISELIDTGIHPLILVFILAVGKLVGQYLMYILGRFLYQIFKKRKKDLAGAENIMHRHRHWVFFIPPFTGTLGNLILVFAGHQRIGFLKFSPILFLADLLRSAMFVYWAVSQIEFIEMF